MGFRLHDNDAQLQGKLAELEAVKFCLTNGFEIAQPVHDRQANWDFIIKFNSEFKHVQVKKIHYKYWKGNTYRRVNTAAFRMRKTGSSVRKYRLDEFELLMAVELDGPSFWLFPLTMILERNVIGLSEPLIPKYAARCKFWTDYRIECVLKELPTWV